MGNKKIYIYVLINPLNNGIFYVGYTYNLKKRLYEHQYSYNLNDNMYKKFVIKKILNAGLKPEIKAIDECDYVFNDELNMFEHERLEIYYIKKYREEGVKLTNLTDGGKNPPTSKRKKIVYQYDKNLNFIKKYESITAAAIEMEIEPTHICAALDQKRNLTCRGYYWLTMSNTNDVIFERKKIIIKKDIKYNTIPIVQYSLNGIFLNEYCGQNEAGRKTGINSKQINKCLRIKGFDQAGGYMWFYKDKIPKEIKKYDGRTFSRRIISYDLDGNVFKEYESIREGSIDLNIDETCICKNLKGIIQRAGKYRFKYCDDNNYINNN
jgi:hypothetical protein